VPEHALTLLRSALLCAAGFHEFAEFVAEDVGTVDSRLNSMVLNTACCWLINGYIAVLCFVMLRSTPAGFHEFAEFVAEDVGTVDSGLNSMVLANNNEMVLLPINEPTFGTKRKSQIQVRCCCCCYCCCCCFLE
jgi:hypothetical protein